MCRERIDDLGGRARGDGADSRAYACVVTFLLLCLTAAGSNIALADDQSTLDLLRRAIPTELIPAGYEERGSPTVTSEGNSVTIRYSGPHSAKVEFELWHFPTLNGPMTSYYDSFMRERKPEQVVSRDLGIGEASCHDTDVWVVSATRNIRLRRFQRVSVFWGKYRLRVAIKGYHHLQGMEMTHEQAIGLTQQLARTTFARIRTTPDLAEMWVEQRHSSWTDSLVQIAARATYPGGIGSYSAGDIDFILRIGSSNQVFRPGAPELRQVGDELHFKVQHAYQGEVDLTVTLTLLDRRHESESSSSVAFRDTLRTKVAIRRPVAQILSARGPVGLERVDPSTAWRGVQVLTSGRVHPLAPQRSGIVELHRIIVSQFPDPLAPSRERVASPMNSRFLYEGDRVVLSTHPDWGGASSRYPWPWLDAPPPLTTIKLRWPGGVQGEAIWNPDGARHNLAGVFVVGSSRSESGQWPLGWADIAPASCGFLFDQTVDQIKGQGIDWAIKRLPQNLPAPFPQVPGGVTGMGFNSTSLGVFSWFGGDTIRDDVRYVNINSDVYIRTRGGACEVFTLEGSPEILNPGARTRVTVAPGQTATMSRGGDTGPRTLLADEMTLIRREVGEVRAGRPPARVDTPGATGTTEGRLPGATVQWLKFFEGPRTPPPLKQRQFRTRFDTGSTRYISWSLQLAYPKQQRRTDFEIEATWFRSNGHVLHRQTHGCYADAGWTACEYNSAFGAAEPSNWTPDTYRVELRIDGRLTTQGSFTVTKEEGRIRPSPPTRKPKLDFSVWPLDAKLRVALDRLDTAMAALSAGPRRDSYSRARQSIAVALVEYLRYRGPDGGIFRGSTDPQDCPHSLLRVLRIGAEDLLQTQAAFDRSPHAPHASAARRAEQRAAVAKAADAAVRAVDEVVAHRGWTTHGGPKNLVVEAPPGFQVFNAETWPMALRARAASGDDDRIVLITWRAMPNNLTYTDFHARAMAQRKADHPDLKTIQSAQRYRGVSGLWSEYSYTWQGKQIRALLYQSPSGPLPWEVRYVAPFDRFDAEECEEIIRTLRQE